MLKRIVYIVSFLFIVSGGYAQKQMVKTWDANNIQTVFIDSDAVYGVTIVSEKRYTIELTATVQGETFESVLVNTSEENETFTITTSRTPFFIPENDKLAAHKVMAIEMQLRVPENLLLKVKSTLASVIISGNFREIQVALEEGNCTATKFRGNASIETKRGFINIEADSSCTGEAVSKYATTTNSLQDRGRFRIYAASIYGVVSLSQTK